MSEGLLAIKLDRPSYRQNNKKYRNDYRNDANRQDSYGENKPFQGRVALATADILGVQGVKVVDSRPVRCLQFDVSASSKNHSFNGNSQ